MSFVSIPSWRISLLFASCRDYLQELQWQEDTARAVEAARAATKAECEAEFAMRRGRDYEQAAADKEAALQFQKKKYVAITHLSSIK